MASLLMNLIRSPVPFHQVRTREWCGVMTNLFRNMFIECVDLDIELSLDSNLQQSEPSAPWLRIFHVSALIAVVSAGSPPLEVRSIQDCDERTEVLLGSNGEAISPINCLKCCGSHGDGGPNRLGLLKGRQQGYRASKVSKSLRAVS